VRAGDRRTSRGAGLPAIPRGTSQERLAGYTVEVAALLKSDRNAAMRSHAQVATSLDPERRMVISGATASIVEIPADVTFQALLAQRCGDRRVGATIDFFPSGASCGGVIAIARQGFGYQIRVNWLTGGVEVVATVKS
jgi:general secretion pathway protein H